MNALANRLRSSFIRQVYPRGKTRRVWRGPLAGMKFVVTPGMGATYAWGGDSMNLSVFKTLISPGDTIYDVGANCGQMALLFSRLAGETGRVLSFEPVPENFKHLEINLKLNKIGNVSALCSALGTDDQPKEFCYEPTHHTMGTFASAQVRGGENRPTIKVDCTTMDSMVAKGAPPPDFIKLDVEGSGGDVINGARQTIERHRPQIYFEVHAATIDAPELRAIGELRDRWSYELRELNGDPIAELRPMWGPAIWCRPPQLRHRESRM